MKYFIFLGIGSILIGTVVFLVWKKTPLKNSNTISTIKNTESPAADDSFIENLRQKEYGGGDIKIEKNLDRNGSYTTYQISYSSDNLKIFGVMNVPKGAGPFPVVILNHGYFNQSSFTSGDGTSGIANILATKGYLTLASDYRGFGKSENDEEQSRGHNPNYAIDVLNLIASTKSLQNAKQNKIGMWGHSMGGEVSLRTAAATDKIKAIVLWAPTSARAEDNRNFYSRGRNTSPLPNQFDTAGSSSIDYLKYISAPVSLHQGLADTEVKPEWSKELRDALKKEEKQIEYLEYPSQDHNFRNLGWDDITEKTLDFFDKYLKRS